MSNGLFLFEIFTSSMQSKGHKRVHLSDVYTDLIDVLSKKATGFHRHLNVVK